MKTLLAVHREVVAELLDGRRRKALVDTLDLLQADHVRRGLAQPAHEVVDARLDAVDVPGGDPHYLASVMTDSIWPPATPSQFPDGPGIAPPLPHRSGVFPASAPLMAKSGTPDFARERPSPRAARSRVRVLAPCSTILSLTRSLRDSASPRRGEEGSCRVCAWMPPHELAHPLHE